MKTVNDPAYLLQCALIESSETHFPIGEFIHLVIGSTVLNAALRFGFGSAHSEDRFEGVYGVPFGQTLPTLASTVDLAAK